MWMVSFSHAMQYCIYLLWFHIQAKRLSIYLSLKKYVYMNIPEIYSIYLENPREYNIPLIWMLSDSVLHCICCAFITICA